MRLPFVLKLPTAIIAWLMVCLIYMPVIAWQEKNPGIAFAGLLSAVGTIGVYGRWPEATEFGVLPATVLFPLFGIAAVLSYQPSLGLIPAFFNAMCALCCVPELWRIVFGPRQPSPRPE